MPDDSPMLVVIEVDEWSIELDLVVPFEGQLSELGSVWIMLGRGLGREARQEPEEFRSLAAPLRLTKDQDAVTKLIAMPYSWMMDEPLLDEEASAYARSLMADPVANDPLRLVCQPILEQAADARNMSMVALMSDSSMFHAHWAAEDVTVGQALTTMVGDVWSAIRLRA